MPGTSSVSLLSCIVTLFLAFLGRESAKKMKVAVKGGAAVDPESGKICG